MASIAIHVLQMRNVTYLTQDDHPQIAATLLCFSATVWI